MQLQKLPQYSKFIAINGNKKPIPLVIVRVHRPNQSQDTYPTNLVDDSAFSESWSALTILRWVYFPAIYVDDPHRVLRELAYARKMPVWPARGSVTIHQGAAIVVLNKVNLDALILQWQQRLHKQ